MHLWVFWCKHIRIVSKYGFSIHPIVRYFWGFHKKDLSLNLCYRRLRTWKWISQYLNWFSDIQSCKFLYRLYEIFWMVAICRKAGLSHLYRKNCKNFRFHTLIQKVSFRLHTFLQLENLKCEHDTSCLIGQRRHCCFFAALP